MENVNCSASNHHSNDKNDCYFEEGPVFSALNLVANFPVPQQKSSAEEDQDDKESFDQDTRRIDDMIKKLGDIVIDEKDKEISDLKCQLENKNGQIVQFEDKLTKLVDFITFMHKRFGNLMESMLSMIRSGDNESFLYFGPFNKAHTKNEFIQIFKDLSAQFLSDHQNLKGTRGLMDKANLILKIMKKATETKKGDNIHAAPNRSLGNDHQRNNVLQDFNGHVHSTAFPVSSTHETPPLEPTTAQLNLTMRSSPSANLSIRRPPPTISRNSMQNNGGGGANLASVNKQHGVDHSKRHLGHFCLCRGTKFNSKASLAMHIRNFTMDKKFECNICQRRYLFRSMLRAHMISSHKVESLIDGTLVCTNCQRKYRNYGQFFAHLDTCHYIMERVLSNYNTTKNGTRSQFDGQDNAPIDMP